jgi:hypothetical protein
MPEVINPISIDQTATEIAVAMSILQEFPDDPLSRWIEYRAYQELVDVLRTADELPAGYVVLTVSAPSLQNWLLTG